MFQSTLEKLQHRTRKRAARRQRRKKKQKQKQGKKKKKKKKNKNKSNNSTMNKSRRHHQYHHYYGWVRRCVFSSAASAPGRDVRCPCGAYVHHTCPPGIQAPGLVWPVRPRKPRKGREVREKGGENSRKIKPTQQRTSWKARSGFLIENPPTRIPHHTGRVRFDRQLVGSVPYLKNWFLRIWFRFEPIRFVVRFGSVRFVSFRFVSSEPHILRNLILRHSKQFTAGSD